MHEVQINIGDTFTWQDFIEMREWCVAHVASDDFYAHPPKEALNKPARFQFANHEDEFAFKMTFGVHDSDDTIDSTTVEIDI